MTIKTNSRPRDLVSFAELTAEEQKDFDYIKGEDQYSPRLFRYKSNVYDTCEFKLTTPFPDFKGWDSFRPDSYFSGVLVRFVEDFEHVIAATYF
jgi:hypothetical protein